VVGQTELAEQHLHRLGVAQRYLERLLAHAERSGAATVAGLPVATLVKLRKQVPRKTLRRRVDGLRKARRNAEQLAQTLHMLHMFASARAVLTGTVDLNAAVRGAVELLRLGFYRNFDAPPIVTLQVAEGLPAVSGSSGLIMGIIVDLATGDAVRGLTIVTRRDHEAVVCEIEVEGGIENGYAAALHAARLCGGTVTRELQPDARHFGLWLPMREPVQALRSGNL
jgi:hypothetical protein